MKYNGKWILRNNKFYPLFCKQLPNIFKSLKFQSIAGGVSKKHRRLFTGQTFEANAGLDDEFDARAFQPIGQLMPFVPFKYYTKMRHRNIVTIDRVGM